MKISKRTALVAVATAAATIAASGLAYAFWTSNGSGNGTSKAGTINFTTTAGTATGVVNLLRPGSIAGTLTGDTVGGDLVVHINNTSGFPIKIVAVQQYGLVTNDKSAATPACTADTGTAGSAGDATTLATAPTITNSATNSGVTVGQSAFKYTPATPITVATGANVDVPIPAALNMATTSVTGCQGAVFTIPVQVQATT